jgi:hypothetical protein
VHRSVNLDHKDRKGMTALDLAEYMDHGDLVAFLEDCARAGLGGKG